MIFPDQVRNVAEEFIKTSLAKFPKVTEVLLSHPMWPTWCDKVAQELSKLEITCSIENLRFNPIKEIQIWAASYADKAISHAEDAYLKQVQSEIPM